VVSDTISTAACGAVDDYLEKHLVGIALVK